MPLPAVVGAAVSAAGAAEGTALAAEAATAAGLGGVATGFGLVRASMAAVNQQIADFNRGLVATGFQLGIVATAARAAADHMAGAVAKFSPAALTRFNLAADDLSASVGEVLLPAFEQTTVAVRAVASVVASLAPGAKNLAAGLAVAGAGFAAVSVAATAAGAALATGFGGIPLLAGAVTGGMLGLAYALKDTAEVQGLVNAAARELTKVLNAAGAAAQTLAPVLGPLADSFARLGGVVSDTLVRVITAAQPEIARVGAAVAEMVRTLSYAAGPLGRVAEAVSAVVGRVVATRAEYFVGVVGMLSEMLAGAGPALERLVEAVGDLWDEGVEAVGTVGTALADLTGDADGLSAAISVVTSVVQLGVPLIRGSAAILAETLELVRAGFDAVAATAGVGAGALDPLGLLSGGGGGGGGSPADRGGIAARVLPPDTYDPNASLGKAVRGVSSGDQQSAIRRAQEAAFGSGQRPEVQAANYLKDIRDFQQNASRYITERQSQDIGKAVADAISPQIASLAAGKQPMGGGESSPWQARQAIAMITGI